MRNVTMDGVDWPVLEPADFVTVRGGEAFRLVEDETGDRFYCYGHLDDEEFLAEVDRYRGQVIDDDGVNSTSEPVHVYARCTTAAGERFHWCAINADTPHSFPITVLEF